MEINGTWPPAYAASDIFDDVSGRGGGIVENAVEESAEDVEDFSEAEPEPYLDDELTETYSKEGDGPLKPGYQIYFTDCLLVPYKVESIGKIGLCINSDILHFAFDPVYDTFKFTVPFKFDIIKPYRDGKANAVLGGKSVVIDRNGNIVG